MRKFLWLILLIWCVFQGCSKNDNTVFEVVMPEEGLSFKAIPGGAIMYYDLPEGKDVMSIRVLYQDAWGQKIIRSGSYACDSLVLPGFSEARQGVPAKVTLCDRNDMESIPLEVTFNTMDSGPIAFFKTVEVKSDWNGFTIKYDAPAKSDGFVNVFYLGKNPLTGEPDTLFLNSFPIKGGPDSVYFVTKQIDSRNTIIIKTEDFQGHVVKQQAWEDITFYTSIKHDPSSIVFEDIASLSHEREDYCLGHKYLFDGDLKGENSFNASEREIKTYFAGPGAVGKPLFILDLQREKKIASVRIYEMLGFQRSWPPSNDPVYSSLFYNAKYRLPVFYPCCVTVEGSVDKQQWYRLGTYKEEPLINKNSWAYIADGKYFRTPEALISEEPIYITIPVSFSAAPCRYLRFTVDEIFDYSRLSSAVAKYNTNKFVMMHEIEVYVSKD